MRLSIICGVVVTVCTGIALTVPGFAQLRGSSPGLSSPTFTSPSKTLEFENEQKRKKTFEDTPFKNQDLKTKYQDFKNQDLKAKNQDFKSKDTKPDKSLKSGESDLKTEKTKNKDLNTLTKDKDLKTLTK